jgi:undecaprenyl-diphosphatase
MNSDSHAKGALYRAVRFLAAVAIPAILIGLFLMLLNAKKAVDADIMFFKFVNAHHTPFLDGLFLSVSYLGDGWIVIPIFFVLICWRIPKNGRRRIIVVAAVALSFSVICNNVVKHFVMRPRPVAYFTSPSLSMATKEPGAYAVHVLGQRLNNNSFPSGHANTALALATLTVLIFGIKFWPAFLVAMGVAYSRVYLGAHFPSDVFAGACMGSVIALTVWYGAARIAQKKRPA